MNTRHYTVLLMLTGLALPAAALASPDPVPHALLPRDLSPWGMFMAADAVVKAVMTGLALASVLTWTVWLVKTFELLQALRQVQGPLAALRRSASLADAGSQAGVVGALLTAASTEMQQSAGLPAAGSKERLGWQCERIQAAAVRHLNRGTGVLATIGSTAPFVGLFGTVWGIMNSFIGISKAQSTSLSVVAPGIAEALLATALGLVAAIPAVMIYNLLARAGAGYRALLGDAVTEVMRLAARDLDRAEAAAMRKAG